MKRDASTVTDMTECIYFMTMAKYKCKFELLSDFTKFYNWLDEFNINNGTDYTVCDTMIIGDEWSFRSNVSYNKLINIMQKADEDGIDNINMMYNTLRLIA